MPAIQLDRLKAQVAQLREDFVQPAQFVRRLHDLFDFYADRTRRPGQVGSRVPLLPHYNTPTPVMRELQRDLAHQAAAAAPETAFCLMDALWADRSFETRLLAASLLPNCQASPAAIVGKLWDWVQPGEDSQVVTALLENGYVALAGAHLDVWSDLVHRWLSSERAGYQSIGVQATSLVIRDPSFENFPPIFSLLTPVVQTAPVAMHSELAHLLEILAARSPTETALFLRQALAVSPNRTITRLVRRCLAFFDPSLQQSLREALTSRLSIDAEG